MNQNGVRRKEGQMDGDGKDQVSESVRNGHGKGSELRVHMVDSRGGGNWALMDLIGRESQGERV